MKIAVDGCPFCGSAAELSFSNPVYGAGGWRIQCTMCKAMIADYKYTETVLGDNTIYTPITTDSLLASLERVLKKWNARAVIPNDR